MVLDVALGALLVLSLAAGWRRGFADSFLHAVGWVLAIILGYVWVPMAAAFLRRHTGLEGRLRTIFEHRLAGSGASTKDLLSGAPRILSDYLNEGASLIKSQAIERFVDVLIWVSALLAIILIIRLLFFLVTLLFSKKKRGGFVAAADSLLGAVFGGVKGLLVACILLAFILPLSNLMGSQLLPDLLESSVGAKALYHNNPIFLLTQFFF